MYPLNMYREGFRFYLCGFLSLFLFLVLPYAFLLGLCLGAFTVFFLYLFSKLRFFRIVIEEVRVTHQEFHKRITEFLKNVNSLDIPDDEECVICMEEFLPNTIIFSVQCPCKDSYYHESCITQWLLKSATCPMCRKDLKSKTFVI